MAGIRNCYTSSRGRTKTMGNFITACYNALSKSCGFLEPTLWHNPPMQEMPLDKDPQNNQEKYKKKFHNFFWFV